MALQLATQALAARLTGARSKGAEPPSNGRRQQEASASASGGRRLATAAAAGTALLAAASRLAGSAAAFDLRITVPEKSSEEAEAVVRTHARNLVRVKELIDARSWRELQAALRAAAANLKQDLYAIIQARPASHRPELRRLYSDLFNSVTSLDYAARDKDEIQVLEHYANIVAKIDEIFSKIM